MDNKQKLLELANKLKAAEKTVTDAEDVLKAMKKARDLIVEQVVPEALENMGVTEFSLETGERVVLEEKITATPPKARRPEAMKWLEENGHGDIIKTTVSIAYTRDEHDLAVAELETLLSKGVPAGMDSKVEAPTLAAWVRGQLEEGNMIPLDLFGVHEIKRAKIKPAKKK